MIFAVIFTFAVTILQTAYGYYKGAWEPSQIYGFEKLPKKNQKYAI